MSRSGLLLAKIVRLDLCCFASFLGKSFHAPLFLAGKTLRAQDGLTLGKIVAKREPLSFVGNLVEQADLIRGEACAARLSDRLQQVLDQAHERVVKPRHWFTPGPQDGVTQVAKRPDRHVWLPSVVA